MKKEILFIAFSTQKGGVGKTAFTVLMASYLHYVKGLEIAVIDCDFPQHSIHVMRECDLKMVMQDDHYKQMAYNQFTRLQRKAYAVVASSLEEAIDNAQDLIETEKVKTNRK